MTELPRIMTPAEWTHFTNFLSASHRPLFNGPGDFWNRLRIRWRAAWLVFTGRGDVINWGEPATPEERRSTASEP